jgi:lipooligosaccharide transport system permease protein
MARVIAFRVLEGHARAYRHTWRGTTITAVVTPVLFLTAIGLGLGGLVDEGGATAEVLGAPSYLAWLAPGLLAVSAMQNGAGDGSFPVVAGIRWLRTYDAALNTPVRPRDLVLGNLAWAAIRGTAIGATFVVIAAIFGAMPFARGAVALGAALLLGLGTCAAVSAYAARSETDQALAGIFRFAVVPLFLFSGAFFPVTELPAAVQPLVVVTPVWHGVELTRSAATSVPPSWSVAGHLAVLVGFLGVATAVAIVVFERRLRR